MRLTLSLCLILGLCVLAGGQSQHKEEVSVNYDRFKDVTTIAIPLEHIKPHIYASLDVIYAGKDRIKDPLLNFEILITQDLEGARFSHKNFKIIYFILNEDKRFEMKLTEYLPEVLTGQIVETARVHLTEAEFNRLTTAKKLEAQWGDTEFEFDKKTLADFAKIKELYDARK